VSLAFSPHSGQTPSKSKVCEAWFCKRIQFCEQRQRLCMSISVGFRVGRAERVAVVRDEAGRGKADILFTNCSFFICRLQWSLTCLYVEQKCIYPLKFSGYAELLFVFVLFILP
jgi:hypothetical protein